MLFRISLIFLICLVWVRYFIRDLGLALAYTATLTASIELIIHFFSSKRNEKNLLKKEDENMAEKISTTFIFSPESAVIYFNTLAQAKYRTKKYSKYIVLNPKNLENETTVLFPFYTYSPLSPQNLVDIIKKIEKHNPNKLVVCGYKIDNETYKIAERIKEFKVVVLDSKNGYLNLIKPYNHLPCNLRETNLKEKLRVRELLKLAISRQRVKGYLIASLFLLISSLFVRLNIYYVVFSSLLLLLALISFFIPQNKLATSENII